jgi:ribosomal protein L37E
VARAKAAPGPRDALANEKRAASAVCPRCGHGVERYPCWQCGYPS